MNLIFDPRSAILQFKDILPDVPARSTLYSEVKSLVAGKYDTDLPAHRRIDPTRAETRCTNRGGKVSVSLKLKSRPYDYGVQKIVNLVHEVFVYLNGSRADYMSESFDLPQE